VSEEDHQKRLTEDASARPEPEEQVIIFWIITPPSFQGLPPTRQTFILGADTNATDTNRYINIL
jgi:hypothetical protein